MLQNIRAPFLKKSGSFIYLYPKLNQPASLFKYLNYLCKEGIIFSSMKKITLIITMLLLISTHAMFPENDLEKHKYKEVANPIFESTSSAVVEEGTSTATIILDVNANDGAGGSTDANVTYTLSGTDAANFNIDANTGAITFAAIPSWSAPADGDTNNNYQFTVTATAGADTTNQEIKIYVFPKNKLTGIETAQQLGASINGEAAGDQSGRSVSFSADGTTIAIGAENNNGNGGGSGHVRLYRYNGSAWVQLGADIDGEDVADASGYATSLSADGNIVAISAPYNSESTMLSLAGHVRVFQYNGSNWVQLGADINGESLEYSGKSVSLSADGNTVAIGTTPLTTAGNVRVFQYNGTDWVQFGATIDGEAFGDDSGHSVSLNADGSILAIGAIDNDGANGENSGHVRVYQHNGTAWVQLGADIDGEAQENNSGKSVSLSANGSIVAIGANNNDEIGTNAGHVRVYQYNGTDWVQLGSDIDGEAALDQFGTSVSLSADGNIIAIGANYNDGANGVDSGHVRLYRYNGSAWEQLGGDIDGEASNDVSGTSVGLSADGTKLIIGAHRNDSNGIDSGNVRVFNIQDSSLSVEDFNQEELSIYPNPTSGDIIINQPVISVVVYDLKGKSIFKTNQAVFSIKKFPPGIYILKIHTSKVTVAKKVVKTK